MKLKLINSIKDIDSVFFKAEYLKTLSDCHGLIGGFKNEKLSCVIPFVINKKIIFKYLRFISDALLIEGSDEDKIEFIENLIPFVKTFKVDFIQCQDAVAYAQYYPKKSVAARFGTYEINLLEDEETLWKNLHGKHRNVIRNAEKREVSIVQDSSNLEISWSILKDTMERSNMSFLSLNEYKDLVDELGKDNIVVFIAYSDSKPICAAALPYDNERAYYLYGGSLSRIPVTGAMNYLHWEAIKFFKNRGLKWYDFVGARLETEKGSKLEGIQRFKARFGANLREGYLWKFIYNPFKYHLFNTIKKLKGFKGDMIDQEIKKGFGVK